jgi:hypothetical protein
MEGTCRHAHTVEELQITKDGEYLQSNGAPLPVYWQQQVWKKQEQLIAQQKFNKYGNNNGMSQMQLQQNLHAQQMQLQLAQQQQQMHYQQMQLQNLQLQRQSSPISPAMGCISPMASFQMTPMNVSTGNSGPTLQVPSATTPHGMSHNAQDGTSDMIQKELERLKMRQAEEQKQLFAQQQAQQMEHQRQLEQLQNSLQAKMNNENEDDKQPQSMTSSLFTPVGIFDSIRNQARCFLGGNNTSNDNTNMNTPSNNSQSMGPNSPFMNSPTAPCTPQGPGGVNTMAPGFSPCFAPNPAAFGVSPGGQNMPSPGSIAPVQGNYTGNMMSPMLVQPYMPNQLNNGSSSPSMFFVPQPILTPQQSANRQSVVTVTY